MTKLSKEGLKINKINITVHIAVAFAFILFLIVKFMI